MHLPLPKPCEEASVGSQCPRSEPPFATHHLRPHPNPQSSQKPLSRPAPFNQVREKFEMRYRSPRTALLMTAHSRGPRFTSDKFRKHLLKTYGLNLKPAQVGPGALLGLR